MCDLLWVLVMVYGSGYLVDDVWLVVVIVFFVIGIVYGCDVVYVVFVVLGWYIIVSLEDG